MKAILSILLGALFTLCFAPYHYFIFGFVSFTGLLLIMDKTYSGGKAFLYGWLFAFGHHVTGLYWISYSMLVEPDKFGWMIPFSATFIPAILALFVGALCWITFKFHFHKITRILFFSSGWTLMEIARGTLFTGFPWNLAGYTFLSHIAIAQAASYVGVYGLSLLAIFAFCSPHFAVRYIKGIHHAPIYKYCLSLYYLMPIIFGITLLSEWGNERIQKLATAPDKTNIRIVQPNIPQKEKFDELRAGDQIFKFFNLSLSPSLKPDYAPDIIIWPEAATTINLDEDKEFLSNLADVIPYSTYLATGSIRQEGWMINRKVFNSIQFVDSEGNVQKSHYDKFHLVPFGEYVPLREIFPFINKITKGIGDFNTGDGPKTIKLSNSPAFSPLICYEIIFPGKVVDHRSAEKPKWIMNVTNDAWFGNTSGPHQHLDAARMRAIEEGLPVIRSANTGISAVVDSFGRVLQKIDVNETGIIDTKLPGAVSEETYFAKHGNETILKLAAGLLILSLALKCVSKVLTRFQ